MNEKKQRIINKALSQLELSNEQKTTVNLMKSIICDESIMPQTDRCNDRHFIPFLQERNKLGKLLTEDQLKLEQSHSRSQYYRLSADHLHYLQRNQVDKDAVPTLMYKLLNGEFISIKSNPNIKEDIYKKIGINVNLDDYKSNKISLLPINQHNINLNQFDSMNITKNNKSFIMKPNQEKLLLKPNRNLQPLQKQMHQQYVTLQSKNSEQLRQILQESNTAKNSNLFNDEKNVSHFEKKLQFSKLHMKQDKLIAQINYKKELNYKSIENSLVYYSPRAMQQVTLNDNDTSAAFTARENSKNSTITHINDISRISNTKNSSKSGQLQQFVYNDSLFFKEIILNQRNMRLIKKEQPPPKVQYDVGYQCMEKHMQNIKINDQHQNKRLICKAENNNELKQCKRNGIINNDKNQELGQHMFYKDEFYKKIMQAQNLLRQNNEIMPKVNLSKQDIIKVADSIQGINQRLQQPLVKGFTSFPQEFMIKMIETKNKAKQLGKLLHVDD